MKTHLLISFSFVAALVSQTLLAQDATAYYNEGVLLKGDKKAAEAIEKFKLAVTKKPDYTEALYEMGWCQNDIKDYSGAIISLRKARPSWTNVPKLFFELGYAFEKNNQPDSALVAFNRCIELKPDYGLAFKELGIISYTKEDYTSAIQFFNRYESLATTDITDYLYWYRKGYALNAQKDYANATVALKRSLSLNTDYTNTYLELGFANTKLKLDDDAIDAYKKAIDLDPKNHVPYNGVAEVYRDNKKDMNQAMTWYQKALAINSSERKANFGMGYCLNSQGKYNEAISYLNKAIASEATYTAAYVELGYSHYMIGKYSEALGYCDRAVELNPKNENARYYKGLIYVAQKNKVMAQKILDELSALSSKLAASLKAKVDGL